MTRTTYCGTNCESPGGSCGAGPAEPPRPSSTLALGIAASTAMFALVDGVAAAAAAGARPIVAGARCGAQPRVTGDTHVPFTTKDIDALRGAAAARWTASRASAAGRRRGGRDRGRAAPRTLRLAHVTGSFFDVLGSAPVVGRPLRPADDVAGAAGALVISHGTWQRRYGGADTGGRPAPFHRVRSRSRSSA